MVDSLFQGQGVGVGGTHNSILTSTDYLSNAARTLNNIEDGFYISPSFLDKLSIHVAKNFLDLPKIKVPLILGARHAPVLRPTALLSQPAWQRTPLRAGTLQTLVAVVYAGIAAHFNCLCLHAPCFACVKNADMLQTCCKHVANTLQTCLTSNTEDCIHA